jgi:hypothetical protein
MLDTLKGAHLKEVAHELNTVGFTRLPESFVGTASGDRGKSRAEFMLGCRMPIPVDRYSDTGIRHRRLGKFVYFPFCRYLESLPPKWDPGLQQYTESYFQSLDFNIDQGGKRREFGALLPEHYLNFFLRDTIETCAAVIRRADLAQPEYVNVHIVQVVATSDRPGISSPPTLHRDGEFFTFAFLLERCNVVGGENVIGTLGVANKHPSEVPAEEIIARFTLERPWEGYVVDDHRVSHFVDAVTIDDSGAHRGYRTILLIDFTPAIPDITK